MFFNDCFVSGPTKDEVFSQNEISRSSHHVTSYPVEAGGFEITFSLYMYSVLSFASAMSLIE